MAGWRQGQGRVNIILLSKSAITNLLVRTEYDEANGNADQMGLDCVEMHVIPVCCGRDHPRHQTLLQRRPPTFFRPHPHTPIRAPRHPPAVEAQRDNFFNSI